MRFVRRASLCVCAVRARPAARAAGSRPRTRATGAKALGMLVRGNLRGFWKQVRGLDVTFLLPLAIGILLAVGGLASVLETQLEENPEEMAGLFFGLVAASVLIGAALGFLLGRVSRKCELQCALADGPIED